LTFVLKSAHPDFSAAAYSAKNLRAFIRQNVPNLVERGRAGADVVYGLSGSSETEPVEQLALFERVPRPISHAPLDSLLTDPRVWKTFASPQSPWRLFLNRSTGLVKVIAPSDLTPPENDWSQIPPCPAETLLEVGRDFIATVPESFRAVLEGTLQEKKWWLPFFDVLQGIGLKTKWIAYRRRRIVAEFERTITALIRDFATLPPGDVPHKEIPIDHPPVQPWAGHANIRKLAIEAVTRMTEAELRSLNLPLGYVIDALNLR
jgi:hypothetical protein